jgi:hypothetical protein
MYNSFKIKQVLNCLKIMVCINGYNGFWKRYFKTTLPEVLLSISGPLKD